MRIAHFLGSSLIDYPGRVSSVVWTVGCNLRCPYCYNAELVLPELAKQLPVVPEQEVLTELARRKGFVQGLVVTGGEPTLHNDLEEFLGRVRALGLSVKLDTNGTLPERLDALLGSGLVDYVALDVKGPWDKYALFTGGKEVGQLVRRSLALLRRSGLAYEVRTTVAPGLEGEDLRRLVEDLKEVPAYYLQPFHDAPSKRLVDESLRGKRALAPRVLAELAEEFKRYLPCRVRG